MQFEDFPNIDYAYLNQTQSINENCAQYMFDQAHQVTGFYHNDKCENMGGEMEIIEQGQSPNYESTGYNNSGLLSTEHHFEELNCVSYQNNQEIVDNGFNIRMALNQAYNKAQDLSNQLSSSEEAGFQRFISTGDSSQTMLSNTCMNNFNIMGTPVHGFNMNSPMEATAASTPNTSAKGDCQNARRNMPVLIVQRVKQSFLDGLPVSGKKFKNYGGRLDYIYSILNRSISFENQLAFREFLNSLDFGNKRTWSIIQEQFASKRADFVNVLLDGIDFFLSQTGAADFQAWVEENKKMKEANKKILYQSKEWFRESFSSKFGGNNDLFNMNC